MIDFPPRAKPLARGLFCLLPLIGDRASGGNFAPHKIPSFPLVIPKKACYTKATTLAHGSWVILINRWS